MIQLSFAGGLRGVRLGLEEEEGLVVDELLGLLALEELLVDWLELDERGGGVTVGLGVLLREERAAG